MNAGHALSRARIFARGGKRKRRQHASDHLAEGQVRRMAAAIKAAQPAGIPLTRFVTIHWEKQGVPHGKGGEATSALLDKARRAMAKRGLPFAYVWSRENAGHGGKGDHAHILFHIQPFKTWPQQVRRWIKAISGKPYRAGVILTRTIGRSLIAHRTAPEAYAADLQSVTAYIAKGASNATAEALGMPQSEKGGRVIGKRYGISRNLSRLVPAKPVSK